MLVSPGQPVSSSVLVLQEERRPRSQGGLGAPASISGRPPCRMQPVCRDGGPRGRARRGAGAEGRGGDRPPGAVRVPERRGGRPPAVGGVAAQASAWALDGLADSVVESAPGCARARPLCLWEPDSRGASRRCFTSGDFTSGDFKTSMGFTLQSHFRFTESAVGRTAAPDAPHPPPPRPRRERLAFARSVCAGDEPMPGVVDGALGSLLMRVTTGTRLVASHGAARRPEAPRRPLRRALGGRGSFSPSPPTLPPSGSPCGRNHAAGAAQTGFAHAAARTDVSCGLFAAERRPSWKARCAVCPPPAEGHLGWSSCVGPGVELP